jgi:hypothetical protein
MRLQGTFNGNRNLLIVFLLASASSFCPGIAAVPQTSANAPSSSVKLSKDLESLAYFAGHWSCQGVFPSNGRQIASEIVFAPDLEGAWLTVRHDDLPPNRYHAFEMWGFDKQTNQFIAFIYDNFGGARKFTSAGWSENTLVWAGEPPNVTATTIERFVFRRADAGQFVVNYEVKRGSVDWAVGDTLTCKK